jgi:hypothetical protein
MKIINKFFKLNYPLFKKGRVIKKENIEYLRDFPNDLALLSYENYSEGILFGFSISHYGKKEQAKYIDGKIIISKGAIKCRIVSYANPRDVKYQILIFPGCELPFSDYGKTVYVKLHIEKFTEHDDFESYGLEVSIEDSEPISSEIELGRFKLDNGWDLRRNYVNFDDLKTDNNTLNILHTRYAGIGEATFCPVVMQQYAKDILKRPYDELEEIDRSFAVMCLNSNVIHKEAIKAYVELRNRNQHRTSNDLDNLYAELRSFLKMSRTRWREEEKQKKDGGTSADTKVEELVKVKKWIES